MTHSRHAPEPARTADPSADSLASAHGAIVVELEAAEHGWEIAPGRRVAGYAFNGQVPGPVIHARQGVPLEVRFTNRLPEPTLIHWHGLRVPAPMDGTQEVQRYAVNGTSGTYTLTFNGGTTGQLAFNASALTVQTALNTQTPAGALGGGLRSLHGLRGGDNRIDGVLIEAGQREQRFRRRFEDLLDRVESAGAHCREHFLVDVRKRERA